ncbi:MAG: sulfite exporter TauE/SafE family protein [Promethearchaeota archaeon]
METILYLAPVLFLFVAGLFSMLGMGGSQVYIPILFWLGMDFKTEAIPLGMLLNLISSVSASFTYGRKKMIQWKVALPFGAMMIIFASIGSLFSTGLSAERLIIIFSIFTIIAALLMLSGWKPKSGAEGIPMSNRKKIIVGLIVGGLLGFIAGLIGRGGGSFIVPILYMMGIGPKLAIATSAFIVTCSGTSALITRLLMGVEINILFWVLCSLSILIGSQIGSHLMAKKIKSKNIKIVFGVVLLSLSIILLVQTLL